MLEADKNKMYAEKVKKIIKMKVKIMIPIQQNNHQETE